MRVIKQKRRTCGAFRVWGFRFRVLGLGSRVGAKGVRVKGVRVKGVRVDGVRVKGLRGQV